MDIENVEKQQRRKNAALGLVRRKLSSVPGVPVSLTGNRLTWMQIRRGHSPTSVQLNFDSFQRETQGAIAQLQHLDLTCLLKTCKRPQQWLDRLDLFFKVLGKRVHAFAKSEHTYAVDDLLPLDALPLSARVNRRVKEVGRGNPSLRNLIGCLTALHVTSRDEPDDRVFEWLVANQHSLARAASGVALNTLVCLCLMSNEIHPVWMEFLLQVLGDRTVRELSTEAPSDYPDRLSGALFCVQAGQELKYPRLPVDDTVGSAFESHLMWLWEAPEAKVAWYTRMMASFVSPHLIPNSLSEYQAAQRESRRLLECLQRIEQVGMSQFKVELGTKVFDEIAFSKMSSLKGSTSLYTLLTFNTHAVYQLSTMPEIRGVTEFVESLDGMPAERRLDLVYYLAEIVDPFSTGTVRWQDIVTLMVPLLRSPARRSRLIAYWLDVLPGALKRNPHSELMGCLVNSLDEGNALKRVVRLLQLSLDDPTIPFTAPWHRVVAYMALSKLTDQQVINFARYLTPENVGLPHVTYISLWRNQVVVAAWFGGDPAGIHRWILSLQDNIPLADNLSLISENVTDKHVTESTRRLANANDMGQVLALADQIQAAMNFCKELPQLRREQRAPTDWIDEYPSETHRALHELSKLTDSARDIAARVMSEHFKSAHSLQQELASIDRMLDAANANATRTPTPTQAKQRVKTRG